jgi:hypothetical protein
VAYNEQSGIWVDPKGQFTVVRVPMKIFTDQIPREFIRFNKHMYWLMTGMYRGEVLYLYRII